MNEWICASMNRPSAVVRTVMSGARPETPLRNAEGSAEIAEAVGYEAVLIEFYAAHHMRPVTIDDIGAVTDAEVGELAQVAALLLEEDLHAVGQMAVGCPLGSAVKRHYDNIDLGAQRVEDARHGHRVPRLEGVSVVAEGAEAEAYAAARHHIRLCATAYAGIANLYGVECLLGRHDSLVTEVVGVVVGHADEVVAASASRPA